MADCNNGVAKMRKSQNIRNKIIKLSSLVMLLIFSKANLLTNTNSYTIELVIGTYGRSVFILDVENIQSFNQTRVIGR